MSNLSVTADDFLYNFRRFVQFFYYVSHGHHWQWAKTDLPYDYLDLACDDLMRVFTGQITQLIWAWPPRHHKTTLLGLFICYYYAVNPCANIMYLSAVSVNIQKMVILVRSVLSSVEFIHFFGPRIGKNIGMQNGFHIQYPGMQGKGGIFYALSFFGPITGEGAGWKADGPGGLIIVDDPLKTQDADSTILRDKCINIFNRTIKSRRNNPGKTPIILSAQRIDENDLTGYLLRTQPDEWVHVQHQALTDGKALNRNCINEAELEKIKRYDNYVYYTQYQQQPSHADHFLFKRRDFQILRKEPDLLFCFVIVDTGESSKQSAANTVFSLFGVFENPYNFTGSDLCIDKYRLLWVDALSVKTEPAELEKTCYNFLVSRSSYKIHHIGIEKKSTGVYLLSLLRDKCGHIDVRAIERRDKRSKTRRLIDVQGYVRRGLVYFVDEAPHYHHCVTNLTQITRKHDNKNVDEADTMADALSYVFGSEQFLRDMTGRSAVSEVFDYNQHVYKKQIADLF